MELGIFGRSILRADGLFPQFEEYAGTDPAGFVLSVNVRRRHLSKGQAALAAAKLKQYYAEETKKRQGNNQHASKVENLPPSSMGKARDKAGARFGVSGKSVDEAEHIFNRWSIGSREPHQWRGGARQQQS